MRSTARHSANRAPSLAYSRNRGSSPSSPSVTVSPWVPASGRHPASALTPAIIDKARDRATGGSGLGLAIARRAAQSLGARIEVESEPGEGSEFRLLLPSGTEPPAADG